MEMGGRRLARMSVSRQFSLLHRSFRLVCNALKRSEEKFNAQSICKTNSELKVEQAPSSVDQLSGMLWHQKVSTQHVATPAAAVKAVTMYSISRSFGIVEGNNSKYKARMVALGKYIPVS